LVVFFTWGQHLYNCEDGNLRPLEREAIDLLLAGDLPVLQQLRDQFRHVVAVRRQHTGVGFYTHFVFDSEVALVPGAPSFVIGDVAVYFEEARHGGILVLFVTSGKIDFLEGTTFGGDRWPEELKTYSLEYANGKRDWAALERTIPSR
jgi:hypothetical protein